MLIVAALKYRDSLECTLSRRYSRLNRKLLHGRPRSSKNVKCSLPDCQMDDSDG